MAHTSDIPDRTRQPAGQTGLGNGDLSEIWGRSKWKNLFAHVDIASLVIFRILFGGIMIWEVYRYISQDRIARYYIEPAYHFHYWPFDFVHPLPGNGMYLLFYVLGILAFMIMTGLFYRVATTLFSLGFLYVFLLEASNYLNHFYLVALMSFIMILVPAHRAFSLDALLFRKIRSVSVPAWSLWIVRFMVGVPYFFGGIAKINPDWLRGQPMSDWMSARYDIPVMGQFMGEKWMTVFMSYAGLGLDLLIVPALLWKKTRLAGFILITLFHLLNSQIFSIGIFPWFMIAATTIYFHPSWPRRIGQMIFRSDRFQLSGAALHPSPQRLNGGQKALTAFLAAWVMIQVLVPLRHFAIPGNVHWTEEGHKWAWHMKLRSKMGHGVFTAKEKITGEVILVDVDKYLNQRQQMKMMGNPHLIWQFCQIVERDYAQHGIQVEVYANVVASLNGRKFQQFIDPTVDLASIPRSLIRPASWILPLETPLSERLE